MSVLILEYKDFINMQNYKKLRKHVYRYTVGILSISNVVFSFRHCFSSV